MEITLQSSGKVRLYLLALWFDRDLNCLQVPMQSYIFSNNTTEKRATAKTPCLNLCSFQCHSHQGKIFMFLKTLEHSVSQCITSLLTHLLYFQTSCLHFFPSCLPSRHMPTPPPLSRGASLCLVYSSSYGSFWNNSDGNSCDKQASFTTQNSYSITIHLENLSFENHFTCI